MHLRLPASLLPYQPACLPAFLAACLPHSLNPLSNPSLPSLLSSPSLPFRSLCYIACILFALLLSITARFFSRFLRVASRIFFCAFVLPALCCRILHCSPAHTVSRPLHAFVFALLPSACVARSVFLLPSRSQLNTTAACSICLPWWICVLIQRMCGTSSLKSLPARSCPPHRLVSVLLCSLQCVACTRSAPPIEFGDALAPKSLIECVQV